MRVNLRLSDRADQPNGCLPDTINSLHRCQAQVTAEAEKPVSVFIPIQWKEIKANGLMVEIQAQAEFVSTEKETSCSRNRPQRQARYSFASSNEYTEVKHRHLSHACGVSPPNCPNGPLVLCTSLAKSHTLVCMRQRVFI